MHYIDISIIIATRNRQKILQETLEHAVNSIKGENAEILVINDGDEELELPVKIINTDKIKFLNNPGRGVSSARNFGVKNAKGSVLFFIDDDMWIRNEAISWIKNTLLVNNSVNAVYNMNWIYPAVLNKKLNDSKIGRYILQSGYNTMWGRMHESGKPPAAGLYPFNIIASCSLIMKKDIFEKIGGYNEKFIFQGEDIDLANKIQSFTIPIFCVFDVTLYHNHQDRFEINEFLKRLSTGFESEFQAVKSGILIAPATLPYKGLKKTVFDVAIHTEKVWISLLKLMPNKNFFIPLSNKIIGALGSLQQYKQWKKILHGCLFILLA